MFLWAGPDRCAHEIWCFTATTNTTSTVPTRPPTCFDGLARAVAHDMWFTIATTTTCLGVPGSLSAKTATFVRCTSSKSPRVYILYCANVVSKPWYRCGCADNTPCRLGDAGSMSFLPWFVPRTEPPVQLHEVGTDRGHIFCTKVAATFTFMCVNVEPGVMTAAAAVAWEAATKISVVSFAQ